MAGASGSQLTVAVRADTGSLATDVRGTVLSNGLAHVRERAREQAYFAALPARLHEGVLSLVAQAWLPMELATAHFQAMDAAFPDPHDQRSNGRSGAERSQNTYVRTVVQGLRSAGADYVPLALERVPSVIARMVRGGSCTVYRSGFKDARIELVGFPFLSARYCHNAWQGMFESSLSLVSRRIFVRNDLAFANHERMALLLSWV
jgi:hypothetical protein